VYSETWYSIPEVADNGCVCVAVGFKKCVRLFEHSNDVAQAEGAAADPKDVLSPLASVQHALKVVLRWGHDTTIKRCCHSLRIYVTLPAPPSRSENASLVNNRLRIDY
jgi:hypothetical protein